MAWLQRVCKSPKRICRIMCVLWVTQSGGGDQLSSDSHSNSIASKVRTIDLLKPPEMA